MALHQIGLMRIISALQYIGLMTKIALCGHLQIKEIIFKCYEKIPSLLILLSKLRISLSYKYAIKVLE